MLLTYSQVLYHLIFFLSTFFVSSFLTFYNVNFFATPPFPFGTAV